MRYETKIPCMGCICLPICRNRDAMLLWVDCELMDAYVTLQGHTYEEYVQCVRSVKRILEGRHDLSM